MGWLRQRGGGTAPAGDGTSFRPSKTNLYDAVKAIFHPATNAGVEADDTDSELDVAVGDGTPPAWSAITGKPAFGTAAVVDTGTDAGDVPVLGTGGVLPDGVIPAGISRDSERQAAIQAAVTALIDGAPANRDTLKELADAIAAITVQGLDQAAADARYLRLAGGVLTGLLTLSGAPTHDLHAATKKYVDDNAGGDGGAGTLNARVERINFGDTNDASGNVELRPTAASIAVVNGAGEPEILSGISGNDFTVAAGVYLVNVHATFDFESNSGIGGITIRQASNNAELDQSSPIYPRSGVSIWSARILLILPAATAINILARRNGTVELTTVHAEFVRLSSGGAVHSAHNRGIGWAAQQVPSALEIAAADTFTSDVLTIPAEPADGDGWLFFYVPDDAGAPDSAKFDGNTHDILGGFTRLAANTFAGHIVYATNAEQDPAILGTGLRTLTLEYDG